MSKYLVKILSICALVVLFAVTVVGAAIGVTEAVGCTLTVVDASIVSDAEKQNFGTSHKVVVKADGKVITDKTIEVAKYTEISLEYVATGYNFKGWYGGNYDLEKDKALNDKTTYKFDITGDTTISAVAELKKFTVNYTGVDEDNAAPTGDVVVEYGEKLYKPAAGLNNEDMFFQGWRIKNATVEAEGESVEGKIYEYATFADPKPPVTKYVLEPAWGAQEYIDYTVNTTIINGKPEKTVLTYNTRDGFKGDTKYNSRGDDYTLVGILFNGQTYSYDKTQNIFTGLGEALVANAETNNEATLVWECVFGSYRFQVRGIADTTENLKGVKAKRNGTLVNLDTEMPNVMFEDTDAENAFDLTDDIYTSFITGKYSDFQTVAGTRVNYAYKYQIVVGEAGFTSSVINGREGAPLTFGSVLNYIKGIYGDRINEFSKITVVFIYA